MSVKALLQSEKDAVKDYGKDILAAKDSHTADVLRHIQNEERHHAEELSGLESSEGNKMEEEKKLPHAGHGYTRTTIEHHDDGSHTICHEHEDGHSHVKYAVEDNDAMHDGVEEHLGEPNDGEEAEDHDHPSHSELLSEIEDLVHQMAHEEHEEGE